MNQMNFHSLGRLLTRFTFRMAVHALGLLVITMLVVPTAALAAGADFNVRQYGATGDGTNMDTAAIQQAIDAAADAGGGTVILPRGTYLSGSLGLKSHVTLQLNQGAT